MKISFLDRMHDYLKDEYEDFLKTLENPMYKGLSVNICKCDTERLKQFFPYELKKSPFSEHGFLIDSSVKAGNHWTHSAGLYYLQEPSAGAAVEALDVQEGMWVFDCCAAPGGKSHQIACALNHTGFLLSNEIDRKRANILMSNMERCGVGENMITCSSLDKLCPTVKGWFDRVLVDAPCSGEGMMKKHELASVEWSKENNKACGLRQLEILETVLPTLKQGGILVYSTCTYAVEENEAVIDEFLKRHPEMELMDANQGKRRCGMNYQQLDVGKLVRIYPMDGGEGHFVAKMRKNDPAEVSSVKKIKNKKLPACVQNFLHEQMDAELNSLQIGDKVYLRRKEFIHLDVPILRQGIFAGEVMKNRFEPHHHFYTSSFLMKQYRHCYEMSEKQLIEYLGGNVIESDTKGYVACTYQKIPLGFGKGDGHIIKNKYPKGLRSSKPF